MLANKFKEFEIILYKYRPEFQDLIKNTLMSDYGLLFEYSTDSSHIAFIFDLICPLLSYKIKSWASSMCAYKFMMGMNSLTFKFNGNQGGLTLCSSSHQQASGFMCWFMPAQSSDFSSRCSVYRTFIMNYSFLIIIRNTS